MAKERVKKLLPKKKWDEIKKTGTLHETLSVKIQSIY